MNKYPHEYEKSINDFLVHLKCQVNEWFMPGDFGVERVDMRKLAALSEYYNVKVTVLEMLDSVIIQLEHEIFDAPIRAVH
ncbi:MAG: hypothetical protein IJ740_05625 [Ruminococcus sp.]|nr:hypothetical protein [Ruminococcus sp.]